MRGETRAGGRISLFVAVHRILAQSSSYAAMADRAFFFATIRPLQYKASTPNLFLVV
jgi:hypothetical protein